MVVRTMKNYVGQERSSHYGGDNNEHTSNLALIYEIKHAQRSNMKSNKLCSPKPQRRAMSTFPGNWQRSDRPENM